MMKTGTYEKVRIWSGQIGSHYARTNRMEYRAESTEAYFAVNDIYPFVRAELREHDPQMARLVERYWGVDPEHVVQLEKDLAAYQQRYSRGPTARRRPVIPRPRRNSPTARYDKRDMTDGPSMSARNWPSNLGSARTW